MGSRSQPFVGDLVMILRISSSMTRLKCDHEEEQGDNGNITLIVTSSSCDQILSILLLKALCWKLQLLGPLKYILHHSIKSLHIITRTE